MIIDVHAHFTTAPGALNHYRARQIQSINKPQKGRINISDEQLDQSLQGHFKHMEMKGIDRLLFSPQASMMGHYFGNELISRYWTEHNNDLIGRVAQRYPDKFLAVCQLPQFPGVSPKNCIDELERCVRDLGFVGCNINPDPAGGAQPFTPGMGDEWWYPLYEKLVELDVPAMIHTSATLNPALHMNGSYYVNQHHSATIEILGSRLFQDFPMLKIISPHGGGAIPYQFSRHRSLHLAEGKEPFEAAVKRVYWDLAIYDKDSMEMMIKRVGVDRVLFATEMWGTANVIDPDTGKYFDDTVSFVKGIDWLTEEDRKKIFEDNARTLFSRAKF